ncbi:MAG: extracellular solute-binding protein [Anaerolineaceae bacterium]|nr:extracellular solute-binding protein [Anaerolineaceae bacterium]
MDMPLKFAKFLRLSGAVIILLSVMPSSVHAEWTGNRHPEVANHPIRSDSITDSGNEIEVRADSFGLPLSADKIAGLYSKPSIYLHQNESISFTALIADDGPYTISFDLAAPASVINQPEGQLSVDGAFPSSDAQGMVFPIYYKNSTEVFPLDRYGNEALPRQERLIRWTRVSLRDVNFGQKYAVQLKLTKGQHQFEFKLTKESIFLGSIYLDRFSKDPDYNQYLKDNPARDYSGAPIVIEAEHSSYKNDTSIRPTSNRSFTVTPYDTYRLLLNSLGGEAWKRSGTTVYYEFNVPEDGLYSITLRALQNFKNNFTVFRRILVNDTVLFDQLNEVAFSYSPDWTNVLLGGNTPYKIYLKKGTNVLGVEANSSPYFAPIEKIKKVLVDINTLALEIKKLTGNQVDVNKDWVLSDYIPDVKERLIAIADDLAIDKDVLTSINQGSGSQEILAYQLAIDNIRSLAKDPDKIPIHMNLFSEGSGSAAQLLANLLPSLQDQPLAVDKIYIHSPETVPAQVNLPFFTSFIEGFKRFINSFKPDPYQSIQADKNELSVWVNRPRQYVDLLQSITDETFTKDTGIKVKFSIMPNESKLVLANAAGIQPDIALGVSTQIPYDLAIRNALKDLRSFPDFDSYIKVYSPGALLSYIINDSVYALPETQDFWVTYYRKDIMDSLGLPIPKTWNQVIEILPELQRYGMNYNTLLSSGSGAKGYLATAPYLFNYGAHLYSPDGFSTGLDSDAAITAMKFMAESFTKYGMPLTTASFYNSFRYGSVPIGVSNFETYVKLMTAAPELKGLWGIDLYPATVLPDGTQNRYATGSAQACIMFEKTAKPNEAWKFLKWWMSTETQTDYQQQLILNYGPEYIWNSANVEAFKALSIPQEHKDVILQQWQWIQEPVKLPGSYMEERELSNAWNKIVFEGVNPRVAIDSSIIIINREITRKMVEFGYLQNGNKVKEFKIPTIDTVKRWMDNAK